MGHATVALRVSHRVETSPGGPDSCAVSWAPRPNSYSAPVAVPQDKTWLARNFSTAANWAFSCANWGLDNPIRQTVHSRDGEPADQMLGGLLRSGSTAVTKAQARENS